MPEENFSSAGQPRPETPLRTMVMLTAGLLLTGGVLLDLDRINAVRDTLDRVAHIAAIEAAASPRPAERAHICQRRFQRTVWTDTEVSMGDVEVSVDDKGTDRTATVSYDATVKLAVGRFFGLDEVTISGEAEVAAPEKQASPTIP